MDDNVEVTKREFDKLIENEFVKSDTQPTTASILQELNHTRKMMFTLPDFTHKELGMRYFEKLMG